MPPDAKAPGRRVRVRVRPRSSTARQGAAFGSRPARSLPAPRAQSTHRPRFQGTPTPDQAQGRPTEPVKVTVRARHQGGRIVRHTATLPNVAAAQAHLDRLEHAKARRAQLRGQNNDTARAKHVQVIVVPRDGQSYADAQKGAHRAQRDYDARVERHDRVIRQVVRAETRAARAHDERDLDLAGVARSSPTGRRRFDRGIEREARTSAPEVVHAARHLSADEKRDFHGEAVKATHYTDGSRIPLRDRPTATTSTLAQLKDTADQHEARRKAAQPKPGDVAGNIKREAVDTLTGLPAAAQELANVAGEQLDTTGRKDHPHTRALIAGAKASATGELAQAAASVAKGHGTDKHLRKAATAAAVTPISTTLSVAGGVGVAARGASIASDVARVAKAGKAARAGTRLHVKVKHAQAQRRVRENLTVDTERKTTTRKQTRARRKALRHGAAHRTGSVATRARVYHRNPLIRAAQKAREDARAARGHDPHQASARGGRLSKAARVVKRDLGGRVDIVKAAGDVHETHARHAITDEMARGHGPKARDVRHAEKRARRAGGKTRQGKRAAAHLFAAMQAGIVKDARTLRQHINVHRQVLATGEIDGHKITPAQRAAVQRNTDELEYALKHNLVEHPDLHAATEQRKDVSVGQDRRRAPRLEGGLERMAGRNAKVIRESRTASMAGGAAEPGHTTASRATPRPGDSAPVAEPSSTTTAKVRYRAPDDPGVDFNRPTAHLIERHDELKADIERLTAAIDKHAREADPKTRAPLRKQLTPRERAQNKGKRKNDPGYIHPPFEQNRRKQYGRQKALEEAVKERDDLATRIEKRRALLDATRAIEAPARGRRVHRTPAETRELVDAHRELGRVRDQLFAKRRRVEMDYRLHENELRSEHYTDRAHKRHGHIVHGRPLQKGDEDFDRALWDRSHEHAQVAEDLKAFTAWTGHRAPGTAQEAEAIATAARELQERRRAGTSEHGGRTGGKHDLIAQALQRPAHIRQIRQANGRIAGYEDELARLENRRVHTAEYAQEHGDALDDYAHDPADDPAGRPKRRRGDDIDRTRAELEDLIAQEKDARPEGPGPIFDLADLSDDELAGLRRAAERIHQGLDRFQTAQQARLARVRNARVRAAEYQRRIARHERMPDDLDAQHEAAQERVKRAEQTGRIVQHDVFDQQRHAAVKEIADERARESMLEAPNEEKYAPDSDPKVIAAEQRGNIGEGGSEPTNSLYAREHMLASPERRARRDEALARQLDTAAEQAKALANPKVTVRARQKSAASAQPVARARKVTGRSATVPPARRGAPDEKGATTPGGQAPPPLGGTGTATPASDRGSYVPTSSELPGDAERTLGVREIRGTWSKTGMLTDDWGAYDPAASQGRLERGITAQSVQAEVLRSAHDGKTQLTAHDADATAAALNARRTGVRYVTVRTRPEDPKGPDTYAVLPKAVADRWKAASTPPGPLMKSARYLNTRFVRSVLPLSATWHAGNAADMLTRLALSGARPGDTQLARQLRTHLADHDEEWAREAIDSIAGGHYGAQGSGDRPKILIHLPKVGPAVDTLASAGGALDKLFALAKSMEAKGARAAQGTALRDQAKALGLEAHDVRNMVEHWKQRPELVEDFHKRTLEIIGDYVHHPMAGRHDMRAAIPFAQWIKASLKFTLATLPAKHPIKTALMFQLSQMTDEQRRLIGASQRITKADAKTLGLPQPRAGFLGGGITLADGRVIPTAPLTSMSAAAGAVSDPYEWGGGLMFPWIDRAAGRALGSRDSASEYGGRTVARVVTGAKRPLAPGKGRDTGNPGSRRALLEGASSLAESFVPGVKQAAGARRGGRRPGLHTTAIASIRQGNRKTAPVKAVVGGKELEPGKYRDGSTARSYGSLRGALGPLAAPQRDFPADPDPVNEGPGGVIYTVKALDGSTYKVDARTGHPVP